MAFQASDVIERYKALEHNCAELGTNILSLETNGWQGWAIRGESDLWDGGRTPHQLAANVYQCLEYVMHGGSGRETWKVPGLLAVPKEIALLAKEVNKLKVLFNEAAIDYRDQYNAVEGRQHLREALARVGASRVHMKHCSRNIVVVDDDIQAISLSWQKEKRSITKITAEECEEKLRKIDPDEQDGGIDAQLNLLESLSKEEQSRLRVVQNQSNPSVKALAYWPNGSKTHMGYLSMPALICNDGAKHLPEFTQLPDTPSTIQRLRKRSDARIGENPLLPAIRVFLIEKRIEPTSK